MEFMVIKSGNRKICYTFHKLDECLKVSLMENDDRHYPIKRLFRNQ